MNLKISNIQSRVTYIFFSSFPILYLVQVNIEEFSLSDSFRPLIISILFFTLVNQFASRLLKNNIKGNIVSSVISLFFYSYGHIYISMNSGFSIGKWNISKSMLLLSMFGILLYLFVFWISKEKGELNRTMEGFFVFGSLLFFLPLLSIFFHLVQTRLIDAGLVSTASDIASITENNHQPMDIYFLVMDGYGREDVLADRFNFDNSDFIENLRDRGFYVADESSSNYNTTILSLNSTLSLDYLTNMDEKVNNFSPTENFYIKMMQNNQVMKLFQNFGVKTISWTSSYGFTNIRKADIFVDFDLTKVTPLGNQLEEMIFETSALRIFLDLGVSEGKFSIQKLVKENVVDARYDYHRGIIDSSFEYLPTVALLDGDYFILAHIVSPHPPFVFDEFGNPLTPNKIFNLANNVNGAEEYLVGYPKQISYVNGRLLQIIDEILENSETPPIIIIQGDHGSGMNVDWGSIENSDIEDRMSILNAIYFPDQNYENLYSTISPVNTFRVVFNQYFSSDYEYLEDLSFFKLIDEWEDFENVTDQVIQK